MNNIEIRKLQQGSTFFYKEKEKNNWVEEIEKVY
jgi:hypothetical protein